MTLKPLHWGILGTGRIVRQFIAAIEESGTGSAVASGSRCTESAAIFQSEYPHLRCYPSYAQLLDDPEINAVYVATPHPFHLEWARKASERKLPVLCEKPLAMNLTEGQAMIDAARTHRSPLVEAFRYRFHPQTHKVCELLRTGVIGDVRQIEASFCFSSLLDPISRLYDPKLGASAILDVGCYTMSMVRLLAGAAHAQAFENPLFLQGMVTHQAAHPTADLTAIANLRFSQDLLAQIRCGITAESRNTLEINGSEGRIEVAYPWSCAPAGKAAEILLHKNTTVQQVEVISPLSAMAHEVLGFSEMVSSNHTESPRMSWADSLGNLAAMDEWRNAKG